MCKILYSDSSSEISLGICIADELKFEDAVQFAINLHRSSNVKHFIHVVSSDSSDSSVLTFERK